MASSAITTSPPTIAAACSGCIANVLPATGFCTGFSDDAAMDDLSDIIGLGEGDEGDEKTAFPGAMSASALLPGYAELHCLSNFSFLRGASHPQELAAAALEHGYTALAITDECSLAGVVRAHAAIKDIEAKAQRRCRSRATCRRAAAEEAGSEADHRQRTASHRCRRRAVLHAHRARDESGGLRQSVRADFACARSFAQGQLQD